MIGTCGGDSEWKWETDSDWSERKREADGCSKTKEGDGVRTLECLRGRLLAERQSSKVSKEAAELLAIKVIELEKELKEETRLRDKAEKRLKLLKKKLDSLKLPQIHEDSEQLTSSEFPPSSTSSCGSTTTTLTQPGPEESESKVQVQNEKSSSVHQDSRIDDNCSQKEEEDASLDNTMALVPVVSLVEIHDQKATADFKVESRSVGEVLDSLRLARERIKGSLEERHIMMMIRAGPS